MYEQNKISEIIKEVINKFIEQVSEDPEGVIKKCWKKIG